LLDQASDLVVPTSFLLDESGNLVRFYLGRITAAQVLKDLRAWPTDRAALLRAALPFPGRAFTTDFRRNWVTFADSFALAGLPGHATAYLHHATETQPENAIAFDHLGIVLAQQNQWQEALQAHQRALELGLPAAQTHIATALVNLGRLPEAENAANRARARAPNDPEALRVWASIAARRGNPAGALTALETALKLDPDNKETHHNLAIALNALGFQSAERGSLDEAANYLRRAIQADPNSAESHRNLGLLYARQSNWKQAEESYRTALGISPRFAEALNDLGGVYFQTGRVPQALPLFQQAHEINPHLVEAWLNIARVYMALNDNKNAVSTLNDLLKAHPGQATATEWFQRLNKR
jgi:tetratricopeptide (TPR) repeat protein